MHAEEMALRTAGTRAKGATLYVSLAPCHHFGKRPPCTKLIIESGIKTVVIGSRDPSKQSKTKAGLDYLKKHRLKIIEGVLEKECKQLNWIYEFNQKHQKPIVILKMATTLDGKIATAGGESKWITGPEARAKVQDLRSQVQAVLVGIGTVQKDNPGLLVKKADALHQPLRIVLDSNLKISLSAQLIDTHAAKTLIVTSAKANAQKVNTLRAKGCAIKIVKTKNGKIDLNDFFKLLKNWNIGSLLVEGGAEIAASFLKTKKVSHLYWFIAPKIMGGQKSKSAVSGAEIKKLTQAIQLNKAAEVEKLGEDLLLKYRLI
jgi:diaminohydroxyphosphoribosylaminopyrimidine deaminase/5-amino-6-(5-phosphoribosylamino)uracil reductase